MLIAPDKFKGTATAFQVGKAIAAAAARAGFAVTELPMADGGEGTLDMLTRQSNGVRRRTLVVTGPLGKPVSAEFAVLDSTGIDSTAVVEMSQASGLALIGGREANDPIAASTAGTGELIVAAAKSGVERILVAVGGSATTDGGFGCIEVMQRNSRHLRGIELLVLADVETAFVDAAKIFAPQKGATPLQVELLDRRLQSLADRYQHEFDIDVRGIVGSGAAGGLAGGLAAMGADIVSGFRFLADLVDLESHIERADIVITGEGSFDEQSLQGKVVGEILSMVANAGRQSLLVAGVIEQSVVPDGVYSVSLTAEFGETRAISETLVCIEESVYAALTCAAKWRLLT